MITTIARPRAALHEWILIPRNVDNFATDLGDGDVRMSGGQRLREAGPAQR